MLLDVVYLSMNRNRSYASVTPRLMEDTTLEIELHIRYCNPVFIGLPSSRMLVSFVLSCDECQRIGNISRRQEMPMNYSLVIDHLMFGALIIWDRFLPLMGILIF